MVVALASNKEAFVMHMAYLEAKMSIQPISKAQMTLLLAKRVSVPKEYAEFLDVFLKKSTAVLSKRSNINKHAIDLEPGKQPPYKSIYSLGLVELEIFKTYIENNLANGVIQPSKFPTKASILFVKKPDGSFCLCENYRSLNNLTIKN